MKRIFPVLCMLACVLFVSCLGNVPPKKSITYYAIEYAAPPGGTFEPLDTYVEMRPFDVAPMYDARSISYRDTAFEQKAYVYHIWRETPGEMLTDRLTRDLQASGAFRVVVGPQSEVPGRFRIEGYAGAFYELNEPEAWWAVLEVVVTVVDDKAVDNAGRVLFQKTYEEKQPCAEQTPKSFVRAMSQAVRLFSSRLVADAHKVIQQRLEQDIR